MKTIIFATGNRGKLREAQDILGSRFSLVTPADKGLTEEIPETGTTLRANSLEKAQYVFARLHTDCFSDDSGLEVDVLGGRPGVYSARYGGSDHDFNANMDRLLADMAIALTDASMAREVGLETPMATRKARFRTVVTLILNGEPHYFDGSLEGSIGLVKRGTGGFGYDPVFIPDEIPAEDGSLVPNTERRTLAELGEDVKNAISHRGKAVRAMAAFLHEK